MTDVTFDWYWEPDNLGECAGHYDRMLDMFDNKHHIKPRIIEAGREAYDMIKGVVHADIHLTRGKRMGPRDVRLHGEKA